MTDDRLDVAAWIAQHLGAGYELEPWQRRAAEALVSGDVDHRAMWMRPRHDSGIALVYEAANAWTRALSEPVKRS